MGFLRDFDGISMGFPWDFDGILMGISWDFDGIIDGNLLTNQYHPAQNYPTIAELKNRYIETETIFKIDNDYLITYQQLLIHQMGLYQKLGTPKSIPCLENQSLLKL